MFLSNQWLNFRRVINTHLVDASGFHSVSADWRFQKVKTKLVIFVCLKVGLSMHLIQQNIFYTPTLIGSLCSILILICIIAGELS